MDTRKFSRFAGRRGRGGGNRSVPLCENSVQLVNPIARSFSSVLPGFCNSSDTFAGTVFQ